jgi:DNA-binding NarL/FixJ family response regulator
MRKKVEVNAPPARVLVVGGRGKLPPIISKLFHKNAEPGAFPLGIEGGHALDAISQSHPNIILIVAPSATNRWINLIKQIKALNQSVKAVILCDRADASCAERFLRAGSDACVLSDDGPDELLSALNDVLAGNLYLSERMLWPVPSGSSKARPRSRAGHLRKHLSRARPKNELIFCAA